jgi:hypothetical protein
MHETILCINYNKFDFATQLKKSFRQFQIAQTKAQTPTGYRAFVFYSNPFSQLPNKLVALDGSRTLVICKVDNSPYKSREWPRDKQVLCCFLIVAKYTLCATGPM